MEPNPLPASLNAMMPGPPLSYPNKKGTVLVWEPAPRLYVTRVVGVLTADGAQAIETAGRRAIAKFGGNQVIFHDWEDMTDYEPEARTRLTNVGLELTRQTEVIHLLTRSTVVRLAVKAASLVIRTMRTHDDRRSFESDLRRTLSDRRGQA